MSTTVHPYDFEDASRLSESYAHERDGAINAYETAIDAAADAQLNYRKAKALAYVTAAAEGGTADAKKIRAEELAADAEHALALADGAVKVARERIAAIEADRALFNKRLEMSMRSPS